MVFRGGLDKKRSNVVYAHHDEPYERKEFNKEIKNFCGAMEAELTGWKAKIYDVVRKVDKPGMAKRGKIFSNVEDFHNLLEDMSSRIDQLRKECPTEWENYREQMDTAHFPMRKKDKETMEHIGKAASVPPVPG